MVIIQYGLYRIIKDGDNYLLQYERNGWNIIGGADLTNTGNHVEWHTWLAGQHGRTILLQWFKGRHLAIGKLWEHRRQAHLPLLKTGQLVGELPY
jgi:hypothetical protein